MSSRKPTPVGFLLGDPVVAAMRRLTPGPLMAERASGFSQQDSSLALVARTVSVPSTAEERGDLVDS